MLRKFIYYDVNWRFVQIAILALGIFVAAVIGFKQNNINQQLIDLNFVPSVAIILEPNSHQLYVYNGGDRSIYVGNVIYYDKFSDKRGSANKWF